MFRAYDSTRERLVAVKLFKLDLAPERGHQLVAEFERLIAADLTRPALAAPLATGISGVSPFLVQDYVAADSLDLALREHGPAPAANVLRIAAQLAGALDVAAAVHVTHGALHPRDVLLSSDDTRLTGLGVTRALARIGVVAPVRRPYTAPERIAGGDWDRRADVFSLAALMHELMWGRRISGLGAQAAEGLTDIAGADLSALRAVFARAVAEHPADRFETALEFAEALRNACPDVAVAPEPVPAPRRRTARAAEPRLPLDEEDGVRVEEARTDLKVRTTPEPTDPKVRTTPEASVAQGHDPEDLSLASHRAAEAERYRDVELAPPIAAPPIVHDVVPDVVPDVVQYELPMAIPAGLITGHDQEPLSALERSRSAIWPLALALGVGIAIGFAGGYGVGSREQPGTAAVTAAAPVATPVPAGREFTEGDVAGATKPAPPAASAAPAPAAKSEEGRLLVRSRPAGAQVSVDGRDYGRTPVAIRDLARGAHRVTIAHDGYATEERRFVITTSRPSPSMMVALARPRAAASHAPQTPAAPAGRLTGALVVDSRPAGAKVYVDGKLVGTTPVSLASVPTGPHAIRLEHDDYRRWSSSVRIAASEQNRVTASLER